MSNKDDETERLKKFFWGDLPQADLPTGRHQMSLWDWGKDCIHEWVDVILFVNSHLRCKHCDIKHSDFLKQKETK